MITVTYTSVDRVRLVRTFKTLAKAQKFAIRSVGETPEIGSNYAVSGDGVGKIQVSGNVGDMPVGLSGLFPALTADREPTGREMEIALYGDGQPTYRVYGPEAGERMYNTKENDRREEELIAGERARLARWEYRDNSDDSCPF
jgi:hypothetical protein